MEWRWFLAWLSLLGALASWPMAALAQDDYESAPPADSTSPGGVSYETGAFTYEVPVLSIGSGDFPQSLSLVYQYRSDGARFPSSAWTTNLDVRTSKTRTDPMLEQGCPPYCNPGDYTWTWNIVVGHRSGSFFKVGAGAGPGPYTPMQLDGSSLTWTSVNPVTFEGKFTYTSGDGAQIVFDSMPINGTSHAWPESWIEPDGTVISYASNTWGRSISTNRGIALFFEASSGKVCTLNLTAHHLPNITSCPAGVPTATFTGATATNAAGEVTNFVYGTDTNDGADGHLICVKKPGQSTCTISNVYDDCDNYGTSFYYDEHWNGSRDRVIQQTFATGEVVTYTHLAAQLIAGEPMTTCRGNAGVTMTQAGATTEVTLAAELPASVEDPLGRVSAMTWIGPDNDYPSFTRLKTHTTPENDRVEYTYDARGNVTETRRKAKPTSGLADIGTSATYPASCASTLADRYTCNKPLTKTDARGNTTTYTYDPQHRHGFVLTESGPAVGGVAPRKKYAYAQRYAWIKNASGGYSQATSPVWVLTEERICRTSMLDLSAGTCSAGAADLVTTSYDYGPNSGPNNLWLRGLAVTADGQTLRTCYGYDAYGRKISETLPNANLTSCP